MSWLAYQLFAGELWHNLAFSSKRVVQRLVDCLRNWATPLQSS
jgi:hypothetical protein